MVASIPSPSADGFHLGPLEVHAYGLMYVVGILVAIWITKRRWTATGGSAELVERVALWGVPAGLIGGRLYFLATSWDEVPDHWWGPLAIWDGGLGIWGGVLGGVAGGALVLHRHGAPIARFLDAAAPALLVAQAIGRIGNYFNQELFGGPTTLPWALRIAPAHRPAGHEQYATFHPTFLYELCWDLALAGLLVWLGRRRCVRAPGLFALYIAGYSLGRIGEELLRVDPAHHVLGLRLNFFVASALTLAALCWFAWTQRPTRRGSIDLKRPGGLLVIGGVVGVLLSGCGQADRAAAARAPSASSSRVDMRLLAWATATDASAGSDRSEHGQQPKRPERKVSAPAVDERPAPHPCSRSKTAHRRTSAKQPSDRTQGWCLDADGRVVQTTVLATWRSAARGPSGRTDSVAIRQATTPAFPAAASSARADRRA